MKIISLSLLLFGLLIPTFGHTKEKLTIASVKQDLNAYHDENGKPTGLVIDLVQTGMDRMNIEVEFKILPWNRALNGTYAGTYDAVLKPFWNPERHEKLDFSREVLIREAIALYKQKGKNITFNGEWNRLKDKKFGVIQGYSYGRYFDKIQALWKLDTDEATDIAHNFTKLMNDRFDLLLGFTSYTEGSIKKFNLQDEIERLPTIVDFAEGHIAFTRARDLTVIRDAFDEQIRWMRQNGIYHQLHQKYGVEYLQ
ncbi:substrate-binding periplasmic protein [Curvivirga sp.]|uniref:substrate-binding periplasmic protein n=1 Tax=Curvivirga sp. TaxID=2856848 RepID=UPI003B5C9B0F